MAYMEFPGVGFTEKDWDSSQNIEGGATDLCGITGIFQKGPINKPTLVHNIDQAIAIFGLYMENAYGMYSVRGFFKNRGGSGNLYINRVVHYSDITDAATMSATMAQASCNDGRASGSEPTLKFYDKYCGAVGNTYGYKIVDKHRVSVATTAEAAENAKKIVVKVVRDFLVGDYILITDKTDNTKKEYAQIVEINTTTRELTLDLVSGLANSYGVGSTVVTADFTLEIYRRSISGPVLEKEFVGCNMDPNSEYYVEHLANSQSSGSTLVEVKDQIIDVDHIYEKNPKITPDIVYLSGGSDGLDGFCDMDIIGDPASKTGNYAFDDIHDMIHCWNSESQSMAVTRAGFDYWTSKMTGMYFGYVPSGLNPQGAANFRDEAGWNTSYGALYHNWGYVSDPIGAGENPEKLVPLTGHILGAMGLNDDTNEDGYGSAPAGEDMVLLDVNRLEFDVNEQNGGVMYGNKDRNVNPVVNLSGNGGIAVWGCRLQSSNKKWRNIHARRIFLYAETNVTQQTRWMVFMNKGEKLYTRATRVISKFLRGLKGLSGETDDERFAFVCSAAINDPDDPYVISRIGLNIVKVGEFIWFEFGHKPEGISLEEV